MSMSMDMGMEPASHDHDQGPDNADGGMVMSATFTTGTTVTLFFSSWRTVSLASYLLTLLFLFALAFFNHFLRALRFQLDHYHPHSEQNDEIQPDPPSVSILGPPRRRHFPVKDRSSPLPRYMELDKDDDANNSNHSAHPSAPLEEDSERDVLVLGDDSSST